MRETSMTRLSHSGSLLFTHGCPMPI